MKFLIDFKNTPFLYTSRVYATVKHLNNFCEKVLSRNIHAIRGNTILDIASHDGTYSFACLQLGARHVTGVEPRKHMIKCSNENLMSLGHDHWEFDFIAADIFDYLPNVTPGQFDTILCFGFFYHTTRQTELLAQVRRIRPKYFILSSKVEDYQIPEYKLRGIQRWECHKTAGYMVFYYENPDQDMATIHHTGLTATPTKSLVEALLRDYGFRFKQLSHDPIAGVSYLAEIGQSNISRTIPLIWQY